MVIFIPVRVFQGKICSGIDVMLYSFMSCNFIGSASVEQLIFFPKGETICIDPRSVDATECFMQIFLAVLLAFNKGNFGKFCNLYGT